MNYYVRESLAIVVGAVLLSAVILGFSLSLTALAVGLVLSSAVVASLLPKENG